MSKEAELTTEELRSLAGDDLPDDLPDREMDSVLQPDPDQAHEGHQENQPPPGPDETPTRTDR